MTDTTPNVPFRKIPCLDSLLREDAVHGLIEEFGRDVVVAAGRAVLDEARAAIAAAAAGGASEPDAAPENLVSRLRVRLDINPSAFKKILDGLIRDGRLVRLAPKVTYHRETLEAARAAALGLIERRGSVTIAELRDRLNLSRKYAQAILEYFDRTGLTKRVEDRHVLARP